MRTVWKGAPGLHRREESRAFHQNLPSPLGMEAESEVLKQAICCRAGGENRASGPGGREEEEKMCSQPTCLAGLGGLQFLGTVFYNH